MNRMLILMSFCVIFFFSRNSYSAEKVIQHTRGGQSPAVNVAPGGTANIIYGISVEKFESIAVELGVTKSALKNFLEDFGGKNIPPDQLDVVLREFAKNFKQMSKEIALFNSALPKFNELKERALHALENGDIKKANELIYSLFLEKCNEVSCREADSTKIATIISNPIRFERNEGISTADFTRFNKFYQSGLRNYQDGKLHEAIIEFESASRILPYWHCYVYLGASHLQLLHYRDAIQYFQIAENAIFNSYRSHLADNAGMSNEQIYENVLNVNKKIDLNMDEEQSLVFSMSDPQLILIYMNLGSALVNDKRYKEAIDVLERAKNLSRPPHPEILFNLGLAYIKSFRYDDALKIFHDLVKIASQDSEAHLILGNLIRDHYPEKLNEALVEIKKAVELAPNDRNKIALALTLWQSASRERATSYDSSIK